MYTLHTCLLAQPIAPGFGRSARAADGEKAEHRAQLVGLDAWLLIAGILQPQPRQVPGCRCGVLHSRLDLATLVLIRLVATTL